MKYDVRINMANTNGAIKAYASININEEFAVSGVKVMEGSKGFFVAMPSYKNSKGEYKDVCFPITKEARQEYDSAVLSAFEQKLSQQHTQNNNTPTQNKPDTQTQEMSM